MIKKCLSLLIIAAALIIFLPKITSADLGPKPTVNIDVFYNQQVVPDPNFSAKMLECISQADFTSREDRDSLKDLIPQFKINKYDSAKNCYWYPAEFAWGGKCNNSKCTFGYMPPSDFKLTVYVPSLDRVFVTNEISRTNFNSHYKVDLLSDGSAKIIETTPTLQQDQILSFIKAFIITIILELLVSLIFVVITKIPKKILVYVLLANMITLPIVWFLFPLFQLSIVAIIIISEIFAILFEMLFIYFISNRAISLKKSILLTILNNLISLFLGAFILILLNSFI